MIWRKVKPRKDVFTAILIAKGRFRSYELMELINLGPNRINDYAIGWTTGVPTPNGPLWHTCLKYYKTLEKAKEVAERFEKRYNKGWRRNSNGVPIKIRKKCYVI